MTKAPGKNTLLLILVGLSSQLALAQDALFEEEQTPTPKNKNSAFSVVATDRGGGIYGQYAFYEEENVAWAKVGFGMVSDRQFGMHRAHPFGSAKAGSVWRPQKNPIGLQASLDVESNHKFGQVGLDIGLRAVDSVNRDFVALLANWSKITDFDNDASGAMISVKLQGQKKITKNLKISGFIQPGIVYGMNGRVEDAGDGSYYRRDGYEQKEHGFGLKYGLEMTYNLGERGRSTPLEVSLSAVSQEMRYKQVSTWGAGPDADIHNRGVIVMLGLKKAF